MDEVAAAQRRSRSRRSAGVHAQRACACPPSSCKRAGTLITALLRRLRAQRLTADASARIAGMHVGIVDVGANTVRLLVAARDGERLVPVREERVPLGLGEEVERTGELSEEKLEETALTAAARVRRAR